mmetsp:Transcript_505/g.792  ORF Transcript_505/g.792 Transcript_505/m.792 type:complete len:140 (-) Transcript_505:95-514(-)
MKLLLSLSLLSSTLSFGSFGGCSGPCCLPDGSYILDSETDCVLQKGASDGGPCPQGWSDQGFQCVTQVQGTCCIDEGYALQPHHSLVEYCKINEVKNTEWYDHPNHCPDGFGYGEEYNPMGECKQGDRKHVGYEQIKFC